jgi:hypothetical protein
MHRKRNRKRDVIAGIVFLGTMFFTFDALLVRHKPCKSCPDQYLRGVDRVVNR